jgi:hypothetical protein
MTVVSSDDEWKFDCVAYSLLLHKSEIQISRAVNSYLCNKPSMSTVKKSVFDERFREHTEKSG